VTVLVDDETQFYVPGVEDAGLDDIEAGVMIGARGSWTEDGSLLATGVKVMGERGPFTDRTGVKP
jgi:hypothetical protein